MMVSVFRTGDQSAIEFAGPSTSTSRDTRARLPAGMSVTVWQDAAESLSSQRSHMLRNELRRVRARVPGADAVFCRAAAGVLGSLGVPTSFLGAITLMPGLDVPASS